MSDPLVPARFLWRFAAPCRRRDPLWTPKDSSLEDSYRLLGLAELEGQVAWAQVRGAWSEAGLVFSVAVRCKRRALWCRPLQSEDSDGLQLWIDTRTFTTFTAPATSATASYFCRPILLIVPGCRSTVPETPAADPAHDLQARGASSSPTATNSSPTCPPSR